MPSIFSNKLARLFLVIIPIFLLFYVGNNLILKKPTAEAKEIAKYIREYPNSKNWKYSEEKSSCLFAFDGCGAAYAELNFESTDSYKEVYSFYSQDLAKDSWENTDAPNPDEGANRFTKSGLDCSIYLNNQLENSGGAPIQGNYKLYVGCGPIR